MPDLTVPAAAGFTAFGLVLGVELGYWWAWLLHGPLPRLPVARWCRAVRAYLAPRELPGDIWRLLTEGRWT